MRHMSDVRQAGPEDIDLLTTIAAQGFSRDPVMCWVFDDPATRLDGLHTLFGGLVRDMLGDRGHVYVLDDVCAAFWRDPSFRHGEQGPEADAPDTAEAPETHHEGGTDPPFPPDVLGRLIILGEAITTAHPHEPHWYLNVVSTLPEHQGRGLGRRVLEPVLARCDAEGVPAYLESTNPRNRSLYRRMGFVETDEIALDGGPSMQAMWREPLA